MSLSRTEPTPPQSGAAAGRARTGGLGHSEPSRRRAQAAADRGTQQSGISSGAGRHDLSEPSLSGDFGLLQEPRVSYTTAWQTAATRRPGRAPARRACAGSAAWAPHVAGQSQCGRVRGGPCGNRPTSVFRSLLGGLRCPPRSPGRQADASGMPGTWEGRRRDCPDHG